MQHIYGNLSFNENSHQFEHFGKVVEDPLYIMSNICKSILTERENEKRKADMHNEIIANGDSVVYDRNGFPVPLSKSFSVKTKNNRCYFIPLHDLHIGLQQLAEDDGMEDASQWASIARFCLRYNEFEAFDYCCEQWCDLTQPEDHDENPLCSPFIRTCEVSSLSPNCRREWIARSELR